MGNRFDPGKESCHIMYLDANNLYNWVMSQSLPTSGFKWMETLEKLKGCFSKLAKKQRKGYFLEVDVSYPDDLHDLHNNLPFMCEKMKINGSKSWFPICFTKKVCDSYHGSRSSPQT